MAEASFDAVQTSKPRPPTRVPMSIVPDMIITSHNKEDRTSIHGERIAQNEIDRIIDKYAEAYNIPHTRVIQAKKTQGFLVEDQELTRIMIDHYMGLHKDFRNQRRDTEYGGNIDEDTVRILRTYDEQEDKKKEIDMRIYYEVHAKETGGVYLDLQDGQQVILISKDSDLPHQTVIDHEALHALSTRGYAKGTYLKPITPYGVSTSERNVNEAVTEVLRIAVEYSTMSPHELYRKVQLSEIPVAYNRYVDALLKILTYSHREGGNPLPIMKVAKYYFGLHTDREMNENDLFSSRLLISVPEEYSDISLDLLNNFENTNN